MEITRSSRKKYNSSKTNSNIHKHKEALAMLATKEMGMPLTQSTADVVDAVD